MFMFASTVAERNKKKRLKSQQEAFQVIIKALVITQEVSPDRLQYSPFWISLKADCINT